VIKASSLPLSSQQSYIGFGDVLVDRKQAIRHLNNIMINLQNDCFVLFRALCRLTIKSQNEGEQMSLRSKTLTLELLHSVLEGSGIAFRSSPQFIALVRHDLVDALLANLVSPSDAIFRLSSNIFLVLVTHFKPHLKREFGSFLQNIFIRIIDSQNRYSFSFFFRSDLY
jgi:hypothetical protein